jgi:hypothetical protein
MDAFVFWPGAFIAVVLLADRAGATRPASLIHDAWCRSVWVVVGLALATLAASALAHRPAMRSAPVGFIVGAVALASLVAAIVLDLRALEKIRGARARGGVSGGAPALDCGTGDETTEHAVNVNASYRDSARSVLVIRGSVPRAIAALRRAVAFHAIALAVAAVTLALGVRASSTSRRCAYAGPPPRCGYAVDSTWGSSPSLKGRGPGG